MKKILFITSLYLVSNQLFSQLVPSEFEQITHLVTFGADSKPGWGDDDHTQIFFFIVPESFTKPVYIRVFDPDIGGQYDEPNGEWDTGVKFSVYGGKGAHSEPDAKKIDPVGNFKSGTLLASKLFQSEEKYDGKWYSFGPFNPMDGEEFPQLNGRVFKVIAEGIAGNDGNLYKYFLSTKNFENKEVEGANAFTYEYSFRLPEVKNSVAHLYPFIEDDVISITQHNFDFDFEGSIMIYSIAKNRHRATPSKNREWGRSKHPIIDEEKNTTVDLQIVKGRTSRNDMVCYVTNQYDEAVAFFSVPVGGPPKFKYKLNVRYKDKDNGND
ncbi:hypothetical protein [Ekhidna sp.]|uniref:hypothetical protein n=1 Tax=Ekhidna sp. TaxID=2608089 RepID=UPI003298372D